MTETDQIKAIAELDGWNHWFNGWNKLEDNTPPLTLTECLPPYLTSRDAIVPVIAKQPKEVQESITGAFWHDHTLDIHDMIDILLATPAQLCEALLRATGKWKD